MHCDLVGMRLNPQLCDYIAVCVHIIMHTSRDDRSASAHSGSQHTQKQRTRAVDANCGHREVANSKSCTRMLQKAVDF